MYLFRYFGISVVAMCNLLSTEDNYRPAFIIIDRKQFSHIFCYTFVCELFQTKHETCRSSVDIYDQWRIQEFGKGGGDTWGSGGLPPVGSRGSAPVGGP